VTGLALCVRRFDLRRFGENREKEKTMNTEKQDVYTRITDKIVADLEKGVRTWMKPWTAANTAGKISRPLRYNGQPYSGINILMLWASATEQGFSAPLWMTFQQALELNAHVRKGEKGSLVVYSNSITRPEDSESGEETEREIRFLKGYTVFNVEQIDGLPEIYYHRHETKLTPVERIAHAEAFFSATGADIRYRGDRAFYACEADYIQLPAIEAFRDAESFYATLAHESAHWTRHPSRLDRDFGRKHWGDEGYAREELVAELAGAFLAADLGLTPEVREDHAAYIASWLTVLKNDKRAIFTAAAHAQRAVEFLHRTGPS
jgi:antirestriction protein ArdC